MASGSNISNIAQMWEEKDVEGLIEALRHGNEYNRENAAKALCKIDDVSAVDPLIQALLTDNPKDVRWYAAIALGKIGDIRAVESLRRALNDDCDCVRMAAFSLSSLIRTLQFMCRPTK